MRALPSVLVLLCAWPLAAHAQDDEFDDVERELGAPRPTGAWQLDDGVGTRELPWDDFDPTHAYLPRGDTQLGLEMRVNALPMRSLYTTERPQLELHGFVNIRYSSRSPWLLRIGIVAAWELHQQANLGGGTLVTSSAAHVRLRIQPLSVELGRNFGLRVGSDIGVQFAPSPGGVRPMVSTATLAQLVVRTDDGRFEGGVHGGFQISGVDRLERPNVFDLNDTGGQTYFFDPVVGLTAGYLF
ncbi:MAG: hypothetical protein R3B82_01800 [Sandaracinaceae bacterium]